MSALADNKEKGGLTMRKICLFLSVLMLILPLSGCWDMKEINNRTYVLGLGMDSIGTDGEYLFTFQRAVPAGIDSSASSNSIKYENITVNAESLAQAVRSITLSSSQELSFTHLSCVIIGSQLAQQQFSHLLEYLMQQTDVRRQCIIAISTDTANSLLNREFPASSSSVGIASLLEELDSSAGHKVISTLSSVSIAALTDRGYCIYAVGSDTSVSGAKIGTSASDAPGMLSIAGAYVFSPEKLIGRLSTEHADILRLFSSRQNDGIINATHRYGKTVYFWIDRSTCSSSCKVVNDRLFYNVEITAYCSLADANGISPGEIGTDIIEEALKKRLGELIELSRNGMGGTFLGLEDTLRRNDYQWYCEHRSDFDEYYRNAEISLEVFCHLERSGVIN